MMRASHHVIIGTLAHVRGQAGMCSATRVGESGDVRRASYILMKRREKEDDCFAVVR